MVRTTALVVVTVLVATCIMAPVSAELGRSRSSMLGFTDFIANHDEYNAYVFDNRGTFNSLPLATRTSIQHSNMESEKVLFRTGYPLVTGDKTFPGPSRWFNGKEYTAWEISYDFEKMEGLEIEIASLKKQVETAKSPEQKIKLQAELKVKEDVYLANMRVNHGYFEHKLDQLMKPKIEELENLLNQIQEKYQARYEAASEDAQATEKIDQEFQKETDPIRLKLKQGGDFKQIVEHLHNVYCDKSMIPKSKAEMKDVDADIAKSRKMLSGLEFRLSDADMAQINLWMAKPWIDLTTN